jgi:cytochrome c553
MKKIVLSMLFVSLGLVAAEGTVPYKSGLLLAPQADKIYAKECAKCHGDDGKATSFSGSSRVSYAVIAGMDATSVAKELEEYKGGEKSHDYRLHNKYGYGSIMRSATKDLSWEELVAVAKYVNGLK